jgi:gamma-glutamyl hercynylcysteine S-oxide synthase
MSKKHRHGPTAPPMPSSDRSGAGAAPAPGRDRAEAARGASEPAVHLKPILGFRPGAYLTVLYAVVLALLVFFLLFYPGLHRRGQYVAVSSVPGRATVSVDGVFAGTTPCTIFVTKGAHTIEAARPWFKAASSPVQVRGRIFATLIVPDRVRKAFQLPLADA